MLGFRAHVARAAFLLALATYFLLFTNIVPSLHTCFAFAGRDRGWEGSGVPASHQEGNHAPGSREDSDRSNAFGEEEICVACLFGARLRGLPAPAGLSTPVLAQTQRIAREAISIPTPADLWTQILPRAPPANTAS